jgi:hypothetical protein
MNRMIKPKGRMTNDRNSLKSEARRAVPTSRSRFGIRSFVIHHSSFTLALVLMLSLARATAQSTNAPSRLDYDSFRLISDRNIFNPNRVARGVSRTTPRASTGPAAHVESFTLVGLMAYEKGVFAFFDGTSGSYKKALEVNGDIGDFKAVAVTPDELKLVSGTNEFVLRVGLQMRREDEGHWFLTEASQAARNRVVVSRARRSGGATSGEPESGTDGAADAGLDSMPEVIVLDPGNAGESTEANGNAAAATDGVTDPVLLRLMQRSQELNSR